MYNGTHKEMKIHLYQLERRNIMNFKLDGNTMVDGDIISPIMAYAEFSDELVDSAPKKIVNTLNNGHDMLMIYKKYRGNIDLSNINHMLAEMDSVMSSYETSDYAIKR
jgi:hypothetical protein